MAACFVRCFPPSVLNRFVNGLSIGDGKLLVTTDLLYQRRKIAELRAALPNLQHVLRHWRSKDGTAPAGTHDFHQLDGPG